MNIALMAHDEKKELMVQICIEYCGILSKQPALRENLFPKLPVLKYSSF